MRLQSSSATSWAMSRLYMHQGDSTQIWLEMTSDGFPILPTPWNGSQYKIKELEEWFKLYIGQHYSMITSFLMSCYLSACRTSKQWSYLPCPIHSTRWAHIDIHQSWISPSRVQMERPMEHAKESHRRLLWPHSAAANGPGPWKGIHIQKNQATQW